MYRMSISFYWYYKSLVVMQFYWHILLIQLHTCSINKIGQVNNIMCNLGSFMHLVLHLHFPPMSREIFGHNQSKPSCFQVQPVTCVIFQVFFIVFEVCCIYSSQMIGNLHEVSTFNRLLLNSTGSSIITLNIVFNVTYYLELHNVIYIYYV